MTGKNEEKQLDHNLSDAQIAEQGVRLVYEIPGLIQMVKNLSSRVDIFESDIKALSGLPSDIKELHSIIELVKKDIRTIQGCIESIPSSIENLHANIEKTNDKTITAIESIKTDMFSKRKITDDYVVPWLLKIMKAIILLCGLAAISALGFGEWAKTIIKAAI